MRCFPLAALTSLIVSSGCSFQQSRSVVSTSSGASETASPAPGTSVTTNSSAVNDPAIGVQQAWTQEKTNANLLNTLENTCSENRLELESLTEKAVQALQAKGMETNYPDVLTSVQQATQTFEGKVYPCSQLFAAVSQVGSQIPTQ